jgi:pimeloyl-ACP methyl ester carboxylesterase
MLEMLNPTGRDVLRFAAQVVRVRSSLLRAMKTDPQQAQDMAVQYFCSPPASARRSPDANRLRDDTQRFFGWSAAQWAAFEAPVKALLSGVEAASVTHDGLKVQCYRWRPASAAGKQKKPLGRLLFCHGWEGYAYNFALLISKALNAGYEVHAFDHLAHGASEGELSGLPMALDTLLTVAAHVNQTAGPVDVLIGHSLGGAASAWAAAHRQIAIKRLVLMAPFYDTRALSSLWAKAHLLPEEIRAALEAGLERASGKRFDDFMPPSLAARFNALADLPVLVIHDRDDKITPFKHSAALAKLVPQVVLHEARKVGHIALLADAACADMVMEFVTAS